jgi:hypothetical protein
VPVLPTHGVPGPLESDQPELVQAPGRASGRHLLPGATQHAVGAESPHRPLNGARVGPDLAAQLLGGPWPRVIVAKQLKDDRSFET